MKDQAESAPAGSFSHLITERLAQGVDHGAVVEKVREEAGWSAHFAFMTVMSAGIAVLGLLLSSPAIVIGAMLISPLMGPTIGLGFALATFDHAELRRTATTLAVGTLVAVFFCLVVVLLSPLQTLTTEIAARTRPNLFDLLVALFSGLAGSYSMIRGRHGTITGVAIATAIMPPLAVIGFGLATSNWTVVAGSSLLFFTNLMVIAASAAILARLYGFAADLSPRQTRLQATLIVAVIAAFAVPLALSLKQIAWEAVAAREVRAALAAGFGPRARLSELDIDFDARPVKVMATILTPHVQANAEQTMNRRVAGVLGVPVEMSIDQLRIGDEAVEAAELAAARGARTDRIAARIADRLALIAGVTPETVTVDSTRRRALVNARRLPGATFATYRALEARAADSEPGWEIRLVPPLMPLPDVEFDGEDPSEEGARRLEDAVWAARRMRLPIGVGASRRSQAERVVHRLSEAGVEARIVEAEGGDSVRLRWLMARQAGQ